MSDTPPEIAEMVRQMLMSRSGAERMMMASASFEAAQKLILASLPPGLTEIEIKRRLCQRLYAGEVDVDAFIAHLKAIERRQAEFGGGFPESPPEER